ncbi:MAG: hypothetical protein Q8Q80_12725 [Methyloversatilis sp.]|uniref:hypothetical protein n=1 Tax=Methyloversatilis sp. TaxID=2569862 RepID=UPI002733FB64|nr:hypothetical protein [Methyloversatilis sp.]MDP3873516.1 hypothetical protein [Methyloversatilis sp.]
MSTLPVIPGTDEAWDEGSLGRDEDYVAVAKQNPDLEARIDEACDLQPISIRLEKSLIQDFKNIASLHNMGYQPLMRQALHRFASCELKRIVNELVAERARHELELEQASAAGAATKATECKPAPKPAAKKKAA